MAAVPLMDENLRRFKNEVINALGGNLVCLLHHGSRVRGETLSLNPAILVKREKHEQDSK